MHFTQIFAILAIGIAGVTAAPGRPSTPERPTAPSGPTIQKASYSKKLTPSESSNPRSLTDQLLQRLSVLLLSREQPGQQEPDLHLPVHEGLFG